MFEAVTNTLPVGAVQAVVLGPCQYLPIVFAISTLRTGCWHTSRCSKRSPVWCVDVVVGTF